MVIPEWLKTFEGRSPASMGELCESWSFRAVYEVFGATKKGKDVGYYYRRLR